MQGFAWSRIPPALRVGFVLIFLDQIGRLYTGLVPGDGGVEAQRYEPWLGMLWLAGDAMCLLGALELRRRNPRAWTLVIAYALALAMAAVWFTVPLWISTDDSHWVEARLTAMRWVGFAAHLVMIVGWVLVSESALLGVAIVLTLLVAEPPPVADGVVGGLTGWLGITSLAAELELRAALDLAMLAALVAAAMGARIVRGVRSPHRARLYERMAACACGAGCIGVVLDVWAEPSAVVVVAMIAACGALAACAAWARHQGERGAWLLQLAAAAFACAATARLTIESTRLGDALAHTAQMGPRTVAVCQLAGVLLALAGLARAERALWFAGACAMVVLVSEPAGLGHLVAALAMAAALGALAIGVHGAAADVDSDAPELPTATLRVG